MKCSFSVPTPDLLNRKLWGGPTVCALPSPPGDCAGWSWQTPGARGLQHSVPDVSLIYVITVPLLHSGQGTHPALRSALGLMLGADPRLTAFPAHTHPMQPDAVSLQPPIPVMQLPGHPGDQVPRGAGAKAPELGRPMHRPRPRGCGSGAHPCHRRAPCAPRRLCAWDSASPGGGPGIGIGRQLPSGAACAKPGWGGGVGPAPSRQRKWSLLYIRPPASQSWEKEGWGGWKNKRKSPCTM